MIASQGGADAAVRNRAVNGAVAVLHEVGPEHFTLELAARRGGMTVQQIRQVFPTRGGLLAAAVEKWSGAVSAPLLPVASKQGAVAYLHALVVAYAEEPALMRLLASVLALSADRNAEGAATFRKLYNTFRETLRVALADDIAAGREASTSGFLR